MKLISPINEKDPGVVPPVIQALLMQDNLKEADEAQNKDLEMISSKEEDKIESILGSVQTPAPPKKRIIKH